MCCFKYCTWKIDFGHSQYCVFNVQWPGRGDSSRWRQKGYSASFWLTSIYLVRLSLYANHLYDWCFSLHERCEQRCFWSWLCETRLCNSCNTDVRARNDTPCTKFLLCLRGFEESCIGRSPKYLCWLKNLFHLYILPRPGLTVCARCVSLSSS